MVLAAPKSITPHVKFKAGVYILTKEEGDVIRHFSMVIVRSFTSGRRT